MFFSCGENRVSRDGATDAQRRDGCNRSLTYLFVYPAAGIIFKATGGGVCYGRLWSGGPLRNQFLFHFLVFTKLVSGENFLKFLIFRFHQRFDLPVF